MTENPDAAGGTSGGGQRHELTARLAVPEMDCPSCAQKVDKSLQRVDGITDATLQPTTGTANVTYDPDRTSEADVVKAIGGAGYEVVGGSDAEG
ncbi:cadmium-transporting ATPase, partial [Haloferax sp. Atlit-4N]|uniref:heavy-metal-associated domain-containing protein n=1 Tax=Haloferax sp. Atlit-4N TaxID=2077206 RepID=UPI000E37B30B